MNEQRREGSLRYHLLPRRGRRGPTPALLVALLVTLMPIGCGGAGPPETRPDAAVAEQQAARALAAIEDRAERHFRAGEAAYEAGNFRRAKAQFDAALDEYAAAEIPQGKEQEFQAAFNELFSRIHVLGLEELAPASEQLVSLEEELIPAELDEEHLERLRARLDEARPAMPEFSLPVPMENHKVLAALDYLTTERRDVVEEGLSRATRYLPMIRPILEEEGVPVELAWVPLIESLFKPGAYSRAAASGMWQFMSGTARLLGLRVDWSVDERNDPVRATRAAARYLKELHQRMDGNWDMALAAYNAGWGRVQRAAARRGTGDFWELADGRYLPRETRDFVPKIYAAILIGSDPDSYGLDIESQEPFAYDEAVVDSRTDIRVLAEAAGTTTEVIRELNPHIKMVTPPVDRYVVRVPEGRGPGFENALAQIPPDQRYDYIEHRVARGESLGLIAQRYGASVAAIQEVNDIRNRHRIRQGQRLVIPARNPGIRAYRSPRVAGYESGERLTYDVVRGDTLDQIASSFGTDVPSLMRWNGLANSLIYPGDELVVYYDTTGNPPAQPVADAGTAPAGNGTNGNGGGTAAGPSAGMAATGGADDTGRRTLYTVRPGDSLYLIARRFGVDVDTLRRWNPDIRTTIYPGDKLTVWGRGELFDDDSRADATTVVRRYTVRRGDSPYTIAQRFGVRLEALLAANNLTRSSRIHPGDELLVPGAGTGTLRYTVRSGDTLGSIARGQGVSLERLLRANGLTRRSVIRPGDELVIPAR